MDNVQNILATNIQTLRKRKEMTQEDLASALGISFQAVSKWETGKSCPDVLMLPSLADVFGCSVDELFSRNKLETGKDGGSGHSPDFPWPDDHNIRGVLCWGHKILSVSNNTLKEYTFRLSSEMDVSNVESMCNIVLEAGSVRGNCKAGQSIKISGSVGGACFAGHTVAVDGDIGGDCKAGHTVAGGNISGDCRAGHTVRIAGDLHGRILNAQKVIVGGKVILDETDEDEPEIDD